MKLPIEQIKITIDELIKKEKPNYFKNKVFSYSQLKLWGQCGHLWHKQYVEKVIPYSQNINLIFGSAFHSVLEAVIPNYYKTGDKINQSVWNGLLKACMDNELEKAVDALMEKGIKDPPATPEQIEEFYKDGCNLYPHVKKLLGTLFHRDNTILLGLEIPILYKLYPNKDIFVYIIIDCVLYDKETDTIMILDFKTAGKPWTHWDVKDESKRLQLILYKEIITKTFPDIPLDKISTDWMIFFRKPGGVEKQPLVVLDERQFPGSITKMFDFSEAVVEVNADGKVVNKTNDKPKNKNPKSCRFCQLKGTVHCDVE